MQRLLTGYALTFNRRHRRNGHLFQNRYKSVLCQEDAYLLELVRYIHLNPLRARVVSETGELERYLFCGHGVLMGKYENDWQDVDYVLKRFGRRRGAARKQYREFVRKGIERGRRPELVGGGLVRSLGGWEAVKTVRRSDKRFKGDERILGDGDFVESVLTAGNERLERRAYLKAAGYDFERLMDRVAEVLEIPVQKILRQGKFARTVEGRSVLCYWANRELGISTVALAIKLNIAQSTVTQSVRRGEKIVAEKRLLLFALA